MKRLILILVISLSTAAIVYSSLSMEGLEGYPAKLFTAIGVFGAFVLFLSGLIESRSTNSSLFDLIISIVPRLLKWSESFKDRTIWVSTIFIAIALLFYYIGPAGIREYSIACDQATSFSLDQSNTRGCSSAVSLKIWRSPIRRANESQVEFTCSAKFGSSLQSWKGRLEEGRCGSRPFRVEYIENGIEIPASVLTTVESSIHSKRITEGIGRLKELLADIPERSNTDNLIFATWNLRYFGSDPEKSFRTQPRSAEALLYMAEVISHFDLLAIQEVFDEKRLVQLMDLLGPDYDFTLGAPSSGKCGLGPEGLGARLGFIFDRRKVTLLDENSSIVVDPDRDERMYSIYPDWEDEGRKFQQQPCRPPFLARFMVQETYFSVFTLHSYHGSNSGPKFIRRLIDNYRVFNYFEKYAKNKLKHEVLLFGGDLNARIVDGDVQKVVESLGFDFLGDSYQVPTNIRGNRTFYDRIGGIFPEDTMMRPATNGAIDLFSAIYRDEDIERFRPEYFDSLRKLTERGKERDNEYKADERRFFRQWRVNNISDHRPKWVEFIIANNKNIIQ